MIVEITGKCAIEDCQSEAKFLACGRESYDENRPGHPEPACYCELHAREVAEEQWPEYTDNCPNCGCMFGVN